MGARFCSFCGRPVPAASAFCPSCGAGVAGAPPLAGAPPPGAAPPPGWGTPGYPGAPGYGAAGYGVPMPSPATRESDVRALGYILWAAIVGLVGAAASLVDLFGSPGGVVGVATTPGGSSVSLNPGALYFLAVIAASGIVLALLELYFCREAFRTLAPVDHRFGTPSTLALLAMIGVVLIALLGAGLFLSLSQAVSCAAGNPITRACINLGAVLGLLGGLVIVAIVALIGYIGVLIGIWRLGARFNDGLFKAGAILLIFPVLNIVALVLIIVAARSHRDQIQGGVAPGAFA
ncbi:MAG TPA: DUF973 family protein [Thermoplasmata archaeon]|nr:DUF973 family protein [Thermoplasmata archaeon]